jgi:ADP-ribose pyrophosphatase
MQEQIEILAEDVAFRGFFKLKRYRLRHSSFHGGWCGEIVRERIEDLAAASVLLYDPVRDRVVLVEQFRIGLHGQAESAWSLETVSGYCDRAQESPEEVARREVLEETGCRLEALHRIGSFFVSPGMSVEQIHLYCGRVDSASADGVHGLEHEGEELRVVVLSRADALAEMFGRLRSTSVIMAMQWLEANRAELLRTWGLDPNAG